MAIKDYSFLKKQKEQEQKVKNTTIKDYSFLIKDKEKANALKLKKEQEEKARQETPIRTVRLPSHLGGGEYKVQVPGEVVRTERGYADLKTLSGSERDHIISVALGGTSSRENLQYLATTKKEGRQQGKVSVEQQAINDYTSGKIDLGEARLRIATKNQQIQGLTPTEEEQTVKGQLKKMFNPIIISGLNFFVRKLSPENIINTVVNKVKNFKEKQEDKKDEIFKDYTEEERKNLSYREKSLIRAEYAKEKELKKIEQEKTPEGQLEKALKREKQLETTAKVLTAPVRFTAGSLATGLVSYGLERADSDLKYTPKTDAEKLIIGETDIQRLYKQEDLYGIVARGASIPVALTLMAVLESPFVSGTGLKPLVKEGLEKVIAKEGVEVISKLGAKEYIKLVDDIIKTETKAIKTEIKAGIKDGNIEKEVGEKALKEINNFRKEINNFRVVEIKETPEVLEQQVKKVETTKQPINEITETTSKEPITYEPLVKESSIPKRIGNEVIEKGLAKDLGELPTYEKVNFKDQAKLVGEIIDTDPELAFRIAMGEAVSPNKALPESVLIAVKNQAIKNGDVDVLRQLATSEKGVAREATELGQRIKMLDERLEDDAFKNINDVVKARNSKLEKSGIKVKEAKVKEIKKIKNEVAKVKPIKDEWLAFVDSIKC